MLKTQICVTRPQCVNIHSLVTPHIYNGLQNVTCSSDTYRHNGGFLIHKTGAHRAFMRIVKINSDNLQCRIFVFKSMITMIIQLTRSFNGY